MSSQKEIVVFAPLFRKLPVEGYGAVERVTISRIKFLQKAGFKVQLVANTLKTDLADSVISINYKKKFPATAIKSAYWFGSLRWTRYVNLFIKIRREIWNSPILCDGGAEDPFNDYLLAKSFGISRVIFFLHGNFYITNGVGHLIFEPLDRLSRISYKMNYGALNTHLNSYLLRKGFKSAFTPNGIEFPELSEINQEASEYLMFIGGINPNKAPHLAIKLARNLNANLEIVGPIQNISYFNEKIRPYINDKIVYRGELPNKELVTLLKSCKALLFTSQWNDPQPTVILESLSLGVPVLSLTPGYYSGVFDMVENNKTGFLGTFEELISSYNSLSELSRKDVYKYAREKWEWGTIIKNFHKPVIEKLSINDE